jgi:hypothetical protein
MKKFVYIMALSIVAAGCINKVKVDFGEVTPQLVMNAQMLARENEQVVYLSESTMATLRPLQGAQVTVLVDGKPFATAVQGEEDDLIATPYYFQGTFPVGSQVKISAKKGSWDAWAQVDVVPGPVISAVDTLRSLERDLDYSYETFQVKITFKDLPGDSYYRVGVRGNFEIIQFDAEGNTLVVPADFELPMSGSKDPVLGGAVAGMSIFDMDKTYLAFTDEMFRDQEYTLRLTIDMEQLYPYYYYWDQEFIPVSSRITSLLFPWLESISREEYDYLNALNNLENFGYTSQVIVEPTTLPTNVNGGLGFVAVRSRTEAAPILLPPVEYEYIVPTEPEFDDEDAGK